MKIWKPIIEISFILCCIIIGIVVAGIVYMMPFEKKTDHATAAFSIYN